MPDAALQLLKREEGRESMSQVALSCRRFLERLADVVFPPIQNEGGEPKRGRDQYRNGLWADVQERLGPDGSEIALKEIGARIDLEGYAKPPYLKRLTCDDACDRPGFA